VANPIESLQAEVEPLAGSPCLARGEHCVRVHLPRLAWMQGREYPVAADVKLISLPIFQSMTDQDVEDVICAITQVCSAFLE